MGSSWWIPPVTAFTGLPGSSQLSALLPVNFAEGYTMSCVEKQQKRHLVDVRAALDTIHQQRLMTSNSQNVQNRKRAAAKSGVRMANYSVGDLVLAASAIHSGNKLAVHWRGPKRVVRSLNDYTFEGQDLCASYARTARHASRLKFYRDSARGVTEDLLSHALHGEGGHLAEALVNCRLSSVSKQWEVFVQWIGLDPEEACWEPAEIIYEDVPKIVWAFVASSAQDHLVRRMWTHLAPKAPIKVPIDEIERRRQPGHSRCWRGK
ncbi:hypothetical protein PC129_g11345 [Phytophthora cactorum]|uniref:Chromo domain-containing protein n=1 Tax=Phytophthora cactorum TaxID=29920 RepID=A0A329T2L5_9STRA|nr:hypothetical protein Pcac1_g11372 [Phytophthora cactorum]KAG2817264.1 hypothetical protein PC112_g13134 [Phytophthora cactorum]KAG2854220.1 hypothetical protein PC113_g13504 [Phytophthora cactorum]KAG2898659.1 hypothetical protein PC114_g14217 [Phytophthora cactorum]KAG2911593.1 hypothetical protein PC115_g12515 [Phytophthora cactorum]